MTVLPVLAISLAAKTAIQTASRPVAPTTVVRLVSGGNGGGAQSDAARPVAPTTVVRPVPPVGPVVPPTNTANPFTVAIHIQSGKIQVTREELGARVVGVMTREHFRAAVRLPDKSVIGDRERTAVRVLLLDRPDGVLYVVITAGWDNDFGSLAQNLCDQIAVEPGRPGGQTDLVPPAESAPQCPHIYLVGGGRPTGPAAVRFFPQAAGIAFEKLGVPVVVLQDQMAFGKAPCGLTAAFVLGGPNKSTCDVGVVVASGDLVAAKLLSESVLRTIDKILFE